MDYIIKFFNMLWWSHDCSMFKSRSGSRKFDKKLAIHKLQYLENKKWQTHPVKSSYFKRNMFWKFLLFALQIKQTVSIYHQIWSIFNLWHNISLLVSDNFLSQCFFFLLIMKVELIDKSDPWILYPARGYF